MPDPDAPSRRLGPMPPCTIQRDFLPEDLLAQLFASAMAREADFASSQLYGGVIDPAQRGSLTAPIFGPLKAALLGCFEAALPDLVAKLRLGAFEPAKYELEIAAYGDKALFKPHLDTFTGRRASPDTDRVLSIVCYFHAEPKLYSGGALRFHRIGALDDQEPLSENVLDIVPERNMLVASPSWVLHEVREVSCPSNRFQDRRFAVNCWAHRAKAPSSLTAAG